MSRLLEIRDLSKSYGSGANALEVLSGINFDLDTGTTTALVGASGAGKSTLMHLLGALDRPTSGSVNFRGENIFKKSERELAAFRNRSIGFVFQFHHLLPEFSALENVCLPGFIANKSKEKVEQRAKEILTFLGLQDRLDHKPNELSGGEKQRVAVARALINDPSVIFADEPTGNLDSKNQQEMHDLFFSLRDKFGVTLIIVTHDREFAKMSDVIIEIKDGMILS